jgi:pyridoxal biosynthesis lyase PdxS
MLEHYSKSQNVLWFVQGSRTLGWIASGIWEGSVLMDHKTQSGGGNQTIGTPKTANATATTINFRTAFSLKYYCTLINRNDHYPYSG